MLIRTAAPSARLEADAARRVISGLVAPWGVYARVSTGQTVAFARAAWPCRNGPNWCSTTTRACEAGRRVRVGHRHRGRPNGHIPGCPAQRTRSDAIPRRGRDGLGDGLSVAAELDTFASENKDGSIWVTAAKGRQHAWPCCRSRPMTRPGSPMVAGPGPTRHHHPATRHHHPATRHHQKGATAVTDTATPAPPAAEPVISTASRRRRRRGPRRQAPGVGRTGPGGRPLPVRPAARAASSAAPASCATPGRPWRMPDRMRPTGGTEPSRWPPTRP